MEIALLLNPAVHCSQVSLLEPHFNIITTIDQSGANLTYMTESAKTSCRYSVVGSDVLVSCDTVTFGAICHLLRFLFSAK